MKIMMTDSNNNTVLVDGDLKEFIHSLINTCGKLGVVFTYRFQSFPNKVVELKFRTKSHAFVYYVYFSAFGRSETYTYMLEVNSNICVNIANMLTRTLMESDESNMYLNIEFTKVAKEG